MSPMEYIQSILGYIGHTLFWMFVIGAGIRMFRTRSAAVVLQMYFIGLPMQPPTQPLLEIVGRMQGVIAFVLSLMGFSPITRLTLTGSEVRCESTSLFGQRLQMIPIRQVSNLVAGIHKPIGNLIWAAVLNVEGLVHSGISSTFWPITLSLVMGIVLVVLYAISKKFFVEIHSQGGPPISLLFKPNILEGVPIDATSAMAVIGVIRDLVMASGNTSMGVPSFVPFAMPTPFVPQQPTPPTVSPPTLANRRDENPADEENDNSMIDEVIIAPDDDAPDPDDVDPAPSHEQAVAPQDASWLSPEDASRMLLNLMPPEEPPEANWLSPEDAAQQLLDAAKKAASAGNRRIAVNTLKQVVSQYPDSQAAKQARRTLERSGIQA